jgi:hypothetical protein
VQAAPACHTCEVVRRTRAIAGTCAAVALAATACLALGCSAAPIDLGIENVEPVIDTTPEVDQPSPDPAEGSTLDPEFDGFSTNLDGKGESAYCRARFEPCGGSLAGTWQVEDTCNPLTNSPKTRRIWGNARMQLDARTCAGAVERLSAVWSGRLAFESQRVYDERLEKETVDVALSRTCLADTFGMEETSDLLSQACASLQDENTSCAESGGICRCSVTTIGAGDVFGNYRELAERVSIGTTFYDYCVSDDRMLWREPGSTRHLVLRRSTGAPPVTTTAPVDVPR